jgi:hypothetical protein
MKRYTTIPYTELPKEAFDMISDEQKSYIDEFTFYKDENDVIQAEYANEIIATWSGEGWIS